MVLSNIELKAVYDSDEDDIVSDFFIPVLSSAKSYKRVAGYFNSTTLAVAARGIKNLLKNGGTMQLVCGCKLSQNDIEALENNQQPQELNTEFLSELNGLEDGDFRRNHAQILGWMIKNKKLEIKIANVDRSSTGIFHMKIGIIEDDTNLITFSGSINETENGWLNSTENFDVHTSWIDGHKEHISGHKQIFEKFWDDQGNKTRVYNLPEAIEKKLIEIAPPNYGEVQSREEYDNRIVFEPRPHQDAAVTAWRNNNFQGIFDIATAGGKTFIGILASELAPKHVITIVTVPTIILQKQWIDELNTHAPHSRIIVVGGDDATKDWDSILHNMLSSYKLMSDSKKHAITKRTIIVATNATAASPKFLELWRDIQPSDVQLIADEVHHLGTTGGQQIFTIPCERKIALSATYARQWDPQGTQAIDNFFGGVCFTYTITEAIADGYLSHYEAHHYDVQLTNPEYEEFHTLTRSIGQCYAIKQQALDRHDYDAAATQDRRMKGFAQDRADIIKSAENKLTAFETIIKQIPYGQKTIVFCTDSTQLDDCSAILDRYSKTHRIYSTVHNLSDVQLKQHIVEFNGDDAKFLVGINCLNEGLDISTCTTCILMSSSGTPREYIQRRGRVLRLGGVTDISHIYDIITYPPTNAVIDDDHRNTIDALLSHELRRSDIICEAADNLQQIENDLGPKFTALGTNLTDIRTRINQP